MKAKAVHKLSDEELLIEADNLRKKLFELKTQAVTEKIQDFSQFSKLTKRYGSGEIAPPRIRKITNSVVREFFDQYLKNGPALVVETYEKLYPEVIIKRY